MLAELSPSSVHRIVIADRSGQVVSDTGWQWAGRPVAGLALPGGQPILVNGQMIGTLYLLAAPLEAAGYAPSFDGMPPRHAKGPAFAAPPPGLLARQQSAFLDRVSQSLLLAAIGATVAALIFGGLLARRITRPLRELTRGAERIAQGRFDERIRVGGDDEVAHLAHAFNQMAEWLRQNEQARRQLVADVAHEPRTPLTIIGGTVQAMRDGVMPADDQSLTTIHDEVVALGRLIADLRDLSLADEGQLQLHHEVVDLRVVLEPVAAAFAAEAAARDVDLNADVPAALPPVIGDAARLRQCVQNLVANALRHTPRTDQVRISARAAGDALEISVAATGQGIAPEHLPHLFERFDRVDPSRTRRSGAPGWAWRSSSRSCPPTAARSPRQATALAVVRRSRYDCRRRRRTMRALQFRSPILALGPPDRAPQPEVILSQQ